MQKKIIKYGIRYCIMDIDVYMENIETGGTGYMAQFIYNGVCYYLSGAIETK